MNNHLEMENPQEISFEILGQRLAHTGRALLINRATYYPASQELVAIKVLTPFSDGQPVYGSTDWMFDGHFEGNPVLPGYFLDEMACLGAAVLHSFLTPAESIPVVRKKDGVEYFGIVRPGDFLSIRVFNGHIPKPGHFTCSAEIRNHGAELVAKISHIYGRDISAMTRRSQKKLIT